MRYLRPTMLAVTMFASSLLGQNAGIGTTDVAWVNTSGFGTPVLSARVLYPVAHTGYNAPLLPTTAGYPVVVFLHGYGIIGSTYGRLGGELAATGVVVVMLDTALTSYIALELDARAMFDAVAAANVEVGGFLENGLDMSRVGLLGHSMGGAVMGLVLNEAPGAMAPNPGYTCGLGLAPVNPALALAGVVVNVPVGLVSGQGDTLTPTGSHAAPFYAALTPTSGLKFHYQLDAACNHMNLVGLAADSPEVFERAKKIAKGFFGQFLMGSVVGLEAVLGDEGLADPHLVAVDMDSVVPQCWADSTLKIGTQTRISVAAEAGYAGLIAASSTSLPIPTFIGTLLLDPASAFSVAEGFMVTERFDLVITVPPAPQLIGATIAFQGAGATINAVFRLGSAITLVIGS